RGYSRDQRPDCQQVVVGLVLSRDGFPLAHEVFPGNTADTTTVEAMLTILTARVGCYSTIEYEEKERILTVSERLSGTFSPPIRWLPWFFPPPMEVNSTFIIPQWWDYLSFHAEVGLRDVELE
ncbi:MAG: hypothetical protein NTX88_12015, partial [Candidatus Atribacteria bacterium]|nr:hypothetical protein [Candidatus Atribacteria bacterium]